MTPPPDQNKRRFATVILSSCHPVILYTLLTAVMTWPLVTNLTTAIPGDSFDGWQNYWNQWWIKVALIDRIQNPLTTDLLYAPTGVGLYFHTLNPFNGLMTMPVQLSGGLILAYNAVVFFSWVIGGYGTYLLTRWLLRAKPNQPQTQNTHAAAFLAGLIFTFSPIHMAHLLGHMQVMSLQWIPFYILALMRALDQLRNAKPWLRSTLLAGLFLALVGLCDWYFVLYLFFFTGLLIAWHLLAELLRTRRLTIKPFITWTAPPIIAGIIFLLLLSPMLIPMIREASQSSFMVRPASDLYILSATIADFFIPNRLHPLFRPNSFTDWIGNQIAPGSERTIAIGYLPLALTICAAIFNRKRAGFWLASALFFFLMALGPAIQPLRVNFADVPATVDPFTAQPSIGSLGTASESTGWLDGWTPFALLNRTVPFMRISRSVSRYALMVQLAIAIAAGIGFATLSSRIAPHHAPRTTNHWPARILATLATLILLAEYWVAPYPLSPPDTPQFYETLRDLPDELPDELSDERSGNGSVLNLPMNYDRPGYLLYQTIHQKPLTIAYISRDDPRTLTERVPLLQHLRHLGPDILDIDPVTVAPTIFNQYNIGYIILDRYKMPSGIERDYPTDLMQQIFANHAPLYEDDRLTVYQTDQLDSSTVQHFMSLEAASSWGALQTMNNGKRYRALVSNEPAIVNLGTNFPRDTHLRIRYRTTPDVTGDALTITLTGTTSDVQQTAPAAPDGAAVELKLVALTDPQQDAQLQLTALSNSQLETIFIEQVSIIE